MSVPPPTSLSLDRVWRPNGCHPDHPKQLSKSRLQLVGNPSCSSGRRSACHTTRSGNKANPELGPCFAPKPRFWGKIPNSFFLRKELNRPSHRIDQTGSKESAWSGDHFRHDSRHRLLLSSILRIPLLQTTNRRATKLEDHQSRTPAHTSKG